VYSGKAGDGETSLQEVQRVILGLTIVDAVEQDHQRGSGTYSRAAHRCQNGPEGCLLS
jgi:hypothetical protein